MAQPKVRIFLRHLRRGVTLFILFALMQILLQYSSYIPGLQWNKVSALVGDYQFDYASWELDALAVKVDETLYGLHPFMDDANSGKDIN